MIILAPLFRNKYMKNYFLKYSLSLLFATIVGCSINKEDNPTPFVTVPGPIVTDVDGNVYQSVKIGDQSWIKSNLDVSKYSDGTPIPEVSNPADWKNLTTGAWCYYNNDPAIGAIYGKLYNWYAAVGIYDEASLENPDLRKKLAPTGWHVPTDDEWTELTTCLGGENVAGAKMKVTGTALWQIPNTSATNESGFTALPGGYLYSGGSFNFMRYLGYWWCISEYNTYLARTRDMYYHDGYANRNFEPKDSGFSVRCVKD